MYVCAGEFLQLFVYADMCVYLVKYVHMCRSVRTNIHNDTEVFLKYAETEHMGLDTSA
jgi:hypothetical protein